MRRPAHAHAYLEQVPQGPGRYWCPTPALSLAGAALLQASRPQPQVRQDCLEPAQRRHEGAVGVRTGSGGEGAGASGAATTPSTAAGGGSVGSATGSVGCRSIPSGATEAPSALFLRLPTSYAP